MTTVNLQQVRAALSQANARWRADDTPLSTLPEALRKRMLGAEPSPEAMAMASAAPRAVAPAFAPAVDWRNHNGNQITPVTQQGGCGSCVSFASSALLESMAHIEGGLWLNLSEADSHFCSNHGANCGGWWPDQCLDQIISRGVCDEPAFPYASAFPNNDIWSGPPQCHLAPDRSQRAVKITNRVVLATPVEVKNYLSTTGPVVGCFTVFDDFFSYTGGIYHHVTGAVAGGHCVEVIGYSEADQCWICKNSWDTTWGVGGFFKIAYADMVFNGQFFPMYGATGVKVPATGFQSMGGKITTPPVVQNNLDGRLEVFARGTDNALWHIWQTAPNNGWSGWASMGGIITSVPSVGRNLDGRLEVFARGTDGALWHIWQTAPNNGWSAWASLGGVITSDPVVGRNRDGRLEVFARGTDGAIWHIWQTAPNNGWSGWASLGLQCLGRLAIGNNADGRLEIFVRGINGSLMHIWQTAPNNGWSGWASLGGIITTSPWVINNADGRLEVFARGTDNALWHIWQTAPNNGWSGWASMGGGITSMPTAGRNKDGRIEVFARGNDGALWHIWQTAPNNGWSGWASLGGGILEEATIGTNLDGRLEPFVRGLDMALWHRWQTAPNNGWN
jgi:acylphosphatase